MDKIILIGLNHKTAPIEIRECLAFSESDACTALAGLCGHPAMDESILISTCNRVELLLTAREIPAGHRGRQSVFCRAKQLPLADFESALYVHHGDEAVRHIFRVAASLDSMVVGEPQILGQIKDGLPAPPCRKAPGSS